MEKISRLWTTHEIFTARNKRVHMALDTWQQDIWSIRVFRGHHIYKDILCLLSEIYFRAEESQIIPMIALLLWLPKTILSLDMCLGVFLVWSTSIEPFRIPHHVLNEKNLNGYTGNYADIYFRGLLSIREILEIFYPRK